MAQQQSEEQRRIEAAMVQARREMLPILNEIHVLTQATLDDLINGKADEIMAHRLKKVLEHTEFYHEAYVDLEGVE